jgi:hypothetical protein
MPSLTLTQRAQRAAKKRNRKIARACPLFAEQFAVTVESQVERLQQQEVAAANYLERLRQFDREKAAYALILRGVVAAHVTVEELAALDARLQRIHGGHGLYSEAEHMGARWADFWWQIVRDLSPDYAQAHCPNTKYHETWAGQCPTCKRLLTTTHNPL